MSSCVYNNGKHQKHHKFLTIQEKLRKKPAPLLTAMTTVYTDNFFSIISTNLARECKMYSTGYVAWHRKNRPNIPLVFPSDEYFVWENTTLILLVRISGNDIMLFRDNALAKPIKVIDLNNPNSIEELKKFIKNQLANNLGAASL